MVTVNVAVVALVWWKSAMSSAAPGANVVEARFLEMAVSYVQVKALHRYVRNKSDYADEDDMTYSNVFRPVLGIGWVVWFIPVYDVWILGRLS